MVECSLWAELVKIIEKGETLILTTHINPDGDALGSEIAIEQYLLSKNKKVSIINISPIIYNYKFLDPQNKIQTYNPAIHDSQIKKADVFIIVDISDWERLGELGKKIRQSKSPKVCIDHHHIENSFADVDIIYKQASSTGELIYEFLEYVGCKIEGEIASALYTCILTDTGSFRFSNTTARTHYIASKLLRTDVNSRAIYEEVYERNTRSKIALMGKALNGIHYECDGQLAWFVITKKMFKDSNASKWDTEGFAEIPRGIDGVEISLMFTELDTSKTKISLRSKGKFIINNVAMKYGGGGHNFAAGAVVNSPLAELMPNVIDDVKKIIDQ